MQDDESLHQLERLIQRREEKKPLRAESKKAAMEEEDKSAIKKREPEVLDECLKMEEDKDIEKEQPLEGNKKKKSTKEIVEVGADGAEEPLPEVSSKKIDQGDVKGGNLLKKFSFIVLLFITFILCGTV